MELQVARVVAGRYELEVPLGRGASGQVWRGRDLATRRHVAVKLVSLDELRAPAMWGETIARFRREAGIVVRLRHPNIVTALEAGRSGEALFLVMELAAGVSLSGMLRQRAGAGLGLLPVAGVLRIAGQVLDGLAAAHAAGVVHRDIKPGNLMVDARLDVKIIDFGIARVLADRGPRVTGQGLLLGTLAYMSPEQASGEDVDGRCDLYSLGCVLYELLTGRRPFTAPTPEALLRMHARATPIPLGSVRPGLPAGLRGLVADLMAKDPAARPASAAQALSRVRAISGGLSATVPRHEADRKTRAVAGRDEPPAPWAPGSGAAASARTGDFLMSPGTVPPGPWAVAAVPAPPVPTPPGPAGGVDRTPRWSPARPRPRRRGRWRSAVSSLITIVVVGGIGLYAWEGTHETLKVISVSVAEPHVPAGCNVTVRLTATAETNGKDGTLSYTWTFRQRKTITRSGTITARTGEDMVQLPAADALSGPHAGNASAQLTITSPDLAVSNVSSFSYSCR